MNNNLEADLRKGFLVLAVLSQLEEKDYGYGLAKNLEEKGFPIDTNTLYPLLRRLEKQNLLESLWDTEEASPRKYYRRTVAGNSAYLELKEAWFEIKRRINFLLED
ncbi:MAG TPA: PadR family transcriptional regulator [Clostridiaceae bacterium]|nr:PadR family transcriptional regulator [Clostridiaceae bacterium]